MRANESLQGDAAPLAVSYEDEWSRFGALPLSKALDIADEASDKQSVK
jgi:hypothetical protein